MSQESSCQPPAVSSTNVVLCLLFTIFLINKDLICYSFCVFFPFLSLVGSFTVSLFSHINSCTIKHTNTHPHTTRYCGLLRLISIHLSFCSSHFVSPHKIIDLISRAREGFCTTPALFFDYCFIYSRSHDRWNIQRSKSTLYGWLFNQIFSLFF